MTKICNECETEYPLTDEYFFKHQSNKGGYGGKCKICIKKLGEQYRTENKKCILERMKQYRKTRKKEIAEYNKQYGKEYKAKNRELGIVYAQRTRAKKYNLPYSLTLNQWLEIKQHFNDCCAYCGKEEYCVHCGITDTLTQDHFIPLSKGGEYTYNNIIPVCKSCNCSKHDKDFFEWYQNQSFYNKEREEKILKFLNYNDGVQQLAIV